MKKKKRSRASKNPAVGGDNKSKGEERVLKDLVEDFGSVSVEEAPALYKEAKAEAVEIWGNSLADDSAAEDQSTTCSTSSGNLASGSSFSVGYSSSTASSSDGFVVTDFVHQGYRNKKGKPKKIVAATGTVSTMLGKNYANSALKRSSIKGNRIKRESGSREDMEQFLFSMLRVDSELDMGLVRDVLSQCGYDVDMALNVLLELSSSLTEPSPNGPSGAYSQEEAHSSREASGSLTDGTSDSASHYSGSDFPDSLWYTGHLSRSSSKAGSTPEVHSSRQEYLELQLPQEVLESLFNMPTPKSAEHEPSTMNWRNIVKQMTSLGHRPDIRTRDGAAVKSSPAAGDEYQVYREAAKQHWESMKFCFQKASTAFSNGERDYAAYMSEQGRLHNKRGQEADEQASQDIFKERNKTIENMITIDLHGQHVKQAMKLLKLHLLFGAYVRSVRAFRVITGCGSHGVGKSRVKQSAINLLKKEGIRWREENRGVLLIWLDEQTEFSFLNSDSDDIE